MFPEEFAKRRKRALQIWKAARRIYYHNRSRLDEIKDDTEKLKSLCVAGTVPDIEDSDYKYMSCILNRKIKTFYQLESVIK